MPFSKPQIRKFYNEVYFPGRSKKLPFGKVSAILSAPDSELPIRIAARAGTAYKQVKNLLALSGIRTEEQMKAAARKVSNASRTVETTDPNTANWIIEQLRNGKKSMQEVSKHSGYSIAAIKNINRRTLSRQNTRSVALSARHERQYGKLRAAIREVLSKKTPEGVYKYTVREVREILRQKGIKVHLSTLNVFSSKLRGEAGRKASGKAVPASARRKVFLRRALKSTFESRPRIIERAIQREASFGRKPTSNAVLLALKKVKKEFRVKTGRRFVESAGKRRKILRRYWTKQPPRSFDWEAMAKSLKMPVYFIRQTIVEQFLRSGYHPIVIEERTRVPQSEILRIREKMKAA